MIEQPYVPAYPPLHPKVGKQVLVLDGVTVCDDPCWKDGRVLLSVTRETMETLWMILNDLQAAATDYDLQNTTPVK